MFDFNVALQLLLPLETPATGRTRIHEAPMPDSHVTWQVQVCAWAAATNPAYPWLPRINWWMIPWWYIYIWDKMCRKNSDQIHVIFSPSLWLQCALLCLPGSLELGWSWTTSPCKSPLVISFASSKFHIIVRQLFLEQLKTVNTPQPLELLT